jgi:hydrogenase maturation protein HypF
LAPQGDGPLILDWQPLLARVLAARRAGTPVATIAAAVHEGLARAIAGVAARLDQQRVVLTGGCFQNRRLTECSVRALTDARFAPYWHREIPPNDGGLAAGQVAWAARQLRGTRPCA